MPTRSASPGEPDRDPGHRGARLSEAGEDRPDALAVGQVGRDGLDRRPTHGRLELGGRALGDDVAVVDDPDAVGEDVGLLEVLRREEDGHALVAREPRDLLPERGPALDVEAGRRLVEEEDPRRVHERHREIEPALHAARIAAHPAVGGLGQAHPGQELVRARPAELPRKPLQRGLEAQVLAPCQERVERRLLQSRADRGSHLRPLVHDVVAGYARGAFRGREERREHVHGRRLARTVGPEEPVDLPGRDGEVDPVDRARAFLEDPDQPLCLDRVLAHDPVP